MRLPTLRHTYSYQNAEEGKHKCSICEDEQAHKMNVVVGSYNEETDEHTLKCSDCTYTETSKEHTYDQEDGSCACGKVKPATILATITFGSSGDMKDGAGVTLVEFEKDGFNVKCEKGSATTDCRIKDADEYRMYKNSKFTVSSEKAFIKLVFHTSSSQGGASDLVTTLNKVTGVTATVSSGIVTAVLSESTTEIGPFILTAQVRVTSLEIWG